MSAEVQAFLDAGGKATRFIAAWATPRRRSTGQREIVGYWTGLDETMLVLDGTPRTFAPMGAAMSFEAPRETLGTNVRTARLNLFGLSPEASDIYRAYDPTQAPIEVVEVVFNPGGVFVGTVRRMIGTIDSAPSEIGDDATLSLNIMSRMAPGTRVLNAKKSYASYLLRGGDTAMEHASLRDVEDDKWQET